MVAMVMGAGGDRSGGVEEEAASHLPPPPFLRSVAEKVANNVRLVITLHPPPLLRAPRS